VDKIRIITTEGLTTCLDPGQGWTISSGGWNFLKKQESWEGHEQALITTIRQEFKRTEEWEEARYRPLTWAVLRALQQINSATRIEAEAVCPSFLSVSGTRRSILLGGKEGPTVKTWESLSSFSPNSGLVVWCKLKKGQQEIRSLDISEKEILSNYDETKSKGAKRQNNRSKKNCTSRAECMVEARQHQNGCERESRFIKISLSRQNKLGRH